MSWVKIDDAFYDHPKFIAAGPAGIALWVTALAWSNRNLTDGFVPSGQIPRLLNFDGMSWETGGVEGLFAVGEDVTGYAVAAALCDLGIFDSAIGGYLIHDYLAYQPSAEQIMAKRDKERNRWHRRAAGYAAVVPDSAHSSTSPPQELRADSAATPRVSQPQPRTDKETERRRKRRPPVDFQPTNAHCDYARDHGLNLPQELEAWVLWCEANGKTYASLNAGFSTWLHRAVSYGRGGPPVASIESLAEPGRSLPPSRVETCPECESSLLACMCARSA